MSYRLFATYEVILPNYLLIYRPKDDKLIYKIQIAEFDIQMELVRGGDWAVKFKDEPFTTSLVEAVLVTASRIENEEHPSVQTPPIEKEDYISYGKFFEKRREIYGNVVKEALERLIHFFKYELRQPNLHPDIHPQVLANPKWTTDTGQEFKTSPRIVVGKPKRLPIKLGEKRYTKEDDNNLNQYLDKAYEPRLFEEFFSNAQGSYYRGNLHRAILELAIACEILVKDYFYGKNSRASEVLEYYENKTHGVGRMLDLIGPVAKQVLGASFKDTNNKDFKNIDYLYRCRNKIAHRGDLTYRDDGGYLHRAGDVDFINWWNSIEKLRGWLESFDANA